VTLQTLLNEPLSWTQDERKKRVQEFALLNRIMPVAEIDRLNGDGISIKRCCMSGPDRPVKLIFSIGGKKRHRVEVSAGERVVVRVNNQDLNGTSPTTIEELAALITSLATQAKQHTPPRGTAAASLPFLYCPD
jgi:hypothetical protein